MYMYNNVLHVEPVLGHNENQVKREVEKWYFIAFSWF